MLKSVLVEINNSKVYSVPLIARNLNISESMIEDIVEQLVRMGYLAEDLGSPSCETKCSGCYVTSCNVVPIKMITITNKGKKLLSM